MTKGVIGVVAYSICIFSTLHAEFNVAIGGVTNGQISTDGSTVLLRTYDPNFGASRWIPPNAPVDVGDLEGGAVNTSANYMTPDGRTIVGYSSSINGDSEAFRWTVGGGMIGLGDLPYGRFQSQAFGCSNFGSIVFGEAHKIVVIGGNQYSDEVAMRWTQIDGITELGVVPNGFERTRAIDCSSNGRIIVGSMYSAANPDAGLKAQLQAYIWKDETNAIVGLGLLQDSTGALTRENFALACSPDGQMIAGFGFPTGYSAAIGANSIWLWTESSGFTDIMEAPGGPNIGGGPAYFQSNPVISDDLKTVVAKYISGTGNGIIRWREGLGIEELEGHQKSIAAFHVSADGNIVVGAAFDYDNTSHAVLWDSTGRIHFMEDLLDEANIDTGTWVLKSANAISADARTIAGHLETGSIFDPMSFHVNLSGLGVFDEPIDENWRESSWYGLYYPEPDSLIWHAEHGWQYLANEHGTIYLYDWGLQSWLWTSEDYYPFCYLYGSNNRWVYYYEGTIPREFYVFGPNEIMSVEDLVPPDP